MKLTPRSVEGKVPPWLTGGVERFFFTLLIALNLPNVDTVTAMLGWMALKMATHWHRPDDTTDPSDPEVSRRKDYAFSALLAGLMSMTFALIGGYMCLSVDS